MKKSLMIISCLLLHFIGRGQVNLVLNPAFEQYSTCPDYIDEVTYCYYWNSLDSSWRAPDFTHEKPGIPEYVNACSSYFATSVPTNFYFNHHTHSGNGMMQVFMFTPLSITNARDYLQGHLSHTLTTGHKYSVRFYTALEQGGSYAANNIGAYLDNGAIDTTLNPGYVQSQYTPQVIDTTIIIDTIGWVKIEDTFTANGTEKLITIGQFSDSAQTHFINSSGTSGCPCALYLIDDVSVIDCDNIPHAGNDTVIHPADSAFIGTHEPLLPYKWYKLGRSTVIDSSGGVWVHPTVTTSYILEQKLCGITKMDTVKIWVWPDTPVHTNAVQQLLSGSFQLYPNPATNELTIDGVKGLEVVFYDVVGREVLHAPIVSDKQAIDIAALDKGVYFVEVVDRSTGLRVVSKILKE